MENTAVLQENLKESKVNLQNSISSLNKCISSYKAERKAEWKLFKKNISNEMNGLEKSLKDLTGLKKK